MKTTITMTGDTRDGVPTAAMDFSLDIEIEAEGHRREDGLTAAEVEQEIKEREGANGS